MKLDCYTNRTYFIIHYIHVNIIYYPNQIPDFLMIKFIHIKRKQFYVIMTIIIS